MSITIVLVDDHRVVTRSLKAYLESFPDLKVVGIATSGEELLRHFDEWKPEIILQDLLMPGGWDGIETIRRIKAHAPSVKVIALTASTDDARRIGALRVGVSGYVRKDAEPEVLLAAVRTVARGGTYFDGEAPIPQEELTPREMDVLRKLVLGLSNKDIGTELSISDETVKSHVANLIAKLQVENRAQAIVQALKRQLVSLDC